MEVTNDVSWLEEKTRWKGLASLICVTRRVERDGKTSNEESFYIASFPMTAKDAARYVQSHWGVENRLHWSLDVVIHEDDCLIHTENAPQNLSILRKMAKVILQNDTSRKISLRRKTNIALMDNDYAFQLLFSSVNGK
ncbi:MAG: ISAs1 family transposase [Clostridia bacterium]|nr:ISAs1 family transposase [Clostridia bacterium]